jgi:amino acid transporter
MAATATAFQPRKTSGLVREGKPIDGFLFNINNAVLGPVVGWILLFGVSLYPGSNILLATVIAFGLCLGVSFAYAFFAATMPRSGGDYVFVSRTFHPALGFASNGLYTILIIYYLGTFGALCGQLALSTIYREFGVAFGHTSWANHSNWFYTDWGKFISGSVIMLAVLPLFVLSSRGLRPYFIFQKIVYAFAIGTFLLTLVLMIAMSHGSFVHAFNTYSAHFTHTQNAYAAVVKAGGTHGSFSLHQTLLSVTWPFFTAGFMILSATWAGEHKTGLRSFLLAIPLSYGVVFVAIMAALVIGLHTFSTTFLNALGLAPPSTYGMGFTPNFIELVGMWVGPVLGIILALGLAAWIIPQVPCIIILVTRVFTAWSLDGVAPSWLGRVNDRNHQPMNAILVVYIGGFIGLYGYSFTHSLSIVTGLLGELFCFWVACVAAMAFPYVRPRLHESSPANKRVAGIPIFTIAGAAGAIGLGAIAVILLADKYSGTNWPGNGYQIFGCIGIFAVLFVYWFIARAVRLRQGIDITTSYRELPPD